MYILNVNSTDGMYISCREFPDPTGTIPGSFFRKDIYEKRK